MLLVIIIIILLSVIWIINVSINEKLNRIEIILDSNDNKNVESSYSR